MSRSREFKPNTVLDAALDLFWRKGYKACSMADVVKKSGVARYGVYQTFKDKDQLYCATLKRYRDKVANIMSKPLQEAGDGGETEGGADYQTLVDHFEHMISELEKGQNQGCFAHQAAIERAGQDANVDKILQDFFAETKNHYRGLITNGISKGQIRELPIEDLVTYVMGIQRAVIAMSKQHCTLEERKTYVHCALILLQP